MDNIILHFQHLIEWLTTKINQVGAGTDTGLRTIPTPSGTTYYTKKFGTGYGITDITNGSVTTPRSGGADIILYSFYDIDTNTLLGVLSDKFGVSFYADGSVLGSISTGIYIEVNYNLAPLSTKTINNGDTLTINTDTDPGGLTIVLPGQVYATGTSGTYYLSLSASGSTYYAETIADQNMIHGGNRHTAAGTIKLPDFDIETCYARCGVNDGVQIRDNKIYEEELDLNIATTYLFNKDGNHSRISKGIGARITCEMSQVYNNSNAVYFNENGNNGTADANLSWQLPYADITTAIANRGTRNVLYGGLGAGGTGLFVESCNISNIILESEYGYIPKIEGTVTIGADGGEVRGFQINGKITISDVSGDVYDCDIFNAFTGIDANCIAAETWNIKRNKIYNCNAGLKLRNGGSSGVFTLNFDKNDVYSNTYGIQHVNGGGANFTINIDNSIFYDNDYGITYDPAAKIVSGYIRNNIFFNNSIYGIEIQSAGTLNETINNNIFHSNIFAIDSNAAKTISYCNFYNNTTDYDASITSNNEITGDPKLCKITSPYKFGISADSPCYRADASSNDIGVIRRLVEINNDDIEINGIEFDGQDEYNDAIYILDSANHIGTTIKWCSIFDFIGIAIDLFDNDTDLDAIISNNLIYNNGNGCKLLYGGNIVNENCIYNNAVFGIWIDQSEHTFNHNVFYGNYYGLYVGSNANNILLKNSIFQQNSYYGIYSEVSIAITYCIIPDATYNINYSNETNIELNIQFINIDSGSENFNLKTKAAGYNFDSAGKNAADDGYDIGAYKVTRAKSDDSWKKYQLANDPTTLDRKNIVKGLNKSEYINGKLSLYGKAHKKVLPLIWNPDEYSTEEQYDTLEYISTLIRTDENEITREETLIRCLLLPDTHYETGSSSTVDSVLKTITLALKNWTWNKYKGWWADVIFESDTGNGTITAATKKLQVAPSPAWTVNEWTGYILYHNYRYYYIVSNDADELTLSDPDGTLTNEANIDWQIQKSFRISKNSKTVLTVLDPDSLLISGTYNFVIDFMECVLQDSVFGGKQLRGFDFEEKNEMTGYAIILQES